VITILLIRYRHALKDWHNSEVSFVVAVELFIELYAVCLAAYAFAAFVV